MSTSTTHGVLAAALLSTALAASAAETSSSGTPAAPKVTPEPAPEVNRAQQLVFLNDLMQNVPAGSVVEYRFTRHGRDLKDYQDRATVTVSRVAADGRRDLQFDFLSGGQHLDFHAASDYQGNPTPIHFLERDIKEMAEATEGDIGYFRNRIRKAFTHPDVRPARISLGDKELEAVQITLRPFVDDPNLQHFKEYANKRYDFLFSEQVPGGLFQIRTLVPAESGDTPVLEEQLTFDHETPAG